MSTDPQAIYPGTFDPVTCGHIDVMERAARIFPRLRVAIVRTTRKETLFSAEERLAMVRDAVGHLPAVHVELFDGLLVEYARRQGCRVLIRGLRAFSDFEYEFQMALTNRNLAPDVETLFLMPKEEHSFISSSMVREIARLGGNTGEFVPPNVYKELARRYGDTREPG